MTPNQYDRATEQSIIAAVRNGRTLPTPSGSSAHWIIIIIIIFKSTPVSLLMCVLSLSLCKHQHNTHLYTTAKSNSAVLCLRQRCSLIESWWTTSRSKNISSYQMLRLAQVDSRRLTTSRRSSTFNVTRPYNGHYYYY